MNSWRDVAVFLDGSPAGGRRAAPLEYRRATPTELVRPVECRAAGSEGPTEAPQEVGSALLTADFRTEIIDRDRDRERVTILAAVSEGEPGGIGNQTDTKPRSACCDGSLRAPDGWGRAWSVMRKRSDARWLLIPDVAELRAALPALGCGRRGRRAGSHVARAGSGPGDPVSDPLFYALRAARNILIDRSRRPITTAIDDLHTAPMDAEAKGCE